MHINKDAHNAASVATTQDTSAGALSLEWPDEPMLQLHTVGYGLGVVGYKWGLAVWDCKNIFWWDACVFSNY